MRIATSSIPRDTLRKILLKQIDPKSVEDYKKVARFYLQCERYDEARAVLEGLLAAFPDQADLKEQLAPSLRAIAQLSAQQLLQELKLRHDAGQHQLVWNDPQAVSHRGRRRRNPPGRPRDDPGLRNPRVAPPGR